MPCGAHRWLSAALLIGTLASCDTGESPEAEAPPSPDGAATADAQASGQTASLSSVAASARGYPALRDTDGTALAEGEYAQWSEGDGLRVILRYDYGDGRSIEEEAAFATGRGDMGLVQERWSWNETREGRTFRRFRVDFRAGTAEGEKHEEGETERWSEEIDVEPGRAFAGFGFTFALRSFRERLVGGEPVRLQAIVFLGGPRVVEVELSHASRDRMRMAGRTLTGDRFEIEPQVPEIADLFVDVPVIRIWLTLPPAEFLRFEGPLVEPGDPTVRIDLLPGGESGSAEPVDPD